MSTAIRPTSVGLGGRKQIVPRENRFRCFRIIKIRLVGTRRCQRFSSTHNSGTEPGGTAPADGRGKRQGFGAPASSTSIYRALGDDLRMSVIIRRRCDRPELVALHPQLKCAPGFRAIIAPVFVVYSTHDPMQSPSDPAVRLPARRLLCDAAQNCSAKGLCRSRRLGKRAAQDRGLRGYLVLQCSGLSGPSTSALS